jgi:hypothetical protein
MNSIGQTSRRLYGGRVALSCPNSTTTCNPNDVDKIGSVIDVVTFTQWTPEFGRLDFGSEQLFGLVLYSTE